MQTKRKPITDRFTERRNCKMLENVVERSEAVTLDEILELNKVKTKELEYEGR